METGFQPLLAEAAGFLLGQRLGVRQPIGAVYREDEEWSWMSLAIRDAVLHWHPDCRDCIANPDEVARMLVLDVLTLNEDRHRRNILVEPLESELELRVWAIDSGNALIGHAQDYAKRVMDAPDPRNHARGLPARALRELALVAAEEAENLEEPVVRQLIEEACMLAREPEVDTIFSALMARCECAQDLTDEYLDLLGDLE